MEKTDSSKISSLANVLKPGMTMTHQSFELACSLVNSGILSEEGVIDSGSCEVHYGANSRIIGETHLRLVRIPEAEQEFAQAFRGVDQNTVYFFESSVQISSQEAGIPSFAEVTYQKAKTDCAKRFMFNKGVPVAKAYEIFMQNGLTPEISESDFYFAYGASMARFQPLVLTEMMEEEVLWRDETARESFYMGVARMQSGDGLAANLANAIQHIESTTIRNRMLFGEASSLRHMFPDSLLVGVVGKEHIWAVHEGFKGNGNTPDEISPFMNEFLAEQSALIQR